MTSQTRSLCTPSVTSGHGVAHGGDHHDAHPPYVIGGARGGGARREPGVMPAQEVCAVLSAEQRQKETKAERCNRILGGNLGHKLRRASEMHFDYQGATAIAQGNQDDSA